MGSQERSLSYSMAAGEDCRQHYEENILEFVNGLRSFFRRRVLGREQAASWPFVAGRYHVLDATAPVVVVMADDAALAEDLASLASRGLCMLSPQCRNASDIEKLISNVAANLAVHDVLLVGSEGEHPAATEALAAILSGGQADSQPAAAMVAAVRAKFDAAFLSALQKQIKVADMRGSREVDKILAKVAELAADAQRPNTGFRASSHDDALGVERVIAATNTAYDLQADKAGGYVVRLENGRIVVEHHNSKQELLRIIEGQTAKDLCVTLIRNGWVSRLDHATYLGRELTKAELALRAGRRYVQDAEPVAPAASGETTH